MRRNSQNFWFQLTHLLRGATQQVENRSRVPFVSTHAPLARCDPTRPMGWKSPSSFNSRTSCEVRQRRQQLVRRLSSFNSRTSCEVRPVAGRPGGTGNWFQLTHLLRGATILNRNKIRAHRVSTHAPLARCDRDWRQVVSLWLGSFNSRTSCEVRRDGVVGCLSGGVSTHAPLARCDNPGRAAETYQSPFQLTHLLRGATRAPCAERDGHRAFQLTHLLRGATNLLYGRGRALIVSTHAPLARCDAEAVGTGENAYRFNSRTSCEVRLAAAAAGGFVAFVSTHAPLARCDWVFPPCFSQPCVSTHAPLARCDSISFSTALCPLVSTHAPLARCDRNIL